MLPSDSSIVRTNSRVMMKSILFCLLCLPLASLGQDGARFSVTGAGIADKQSVLKGVERDFFSPVPQDQWNALPTLLEVTFQFEPSRGNTDNLEALRAF